MASSRSGCTPPPLSPPETGATDSNRFWRLRALPVRSSSARKKGEDVGRDRPALDAAAGSALGPDARLQALDGQLVATKQPVPHLEAAAPPPRDRRLDDHPVAEGRRL